MINQLLYKVAQVTIGTFAAFTPAEIDALEAMLKRDRATLESGDYISPLLADPANRADALEGIAQAEAFVTFWRAIENRYAK